MATIAVTHPLVVVCNYEWTGDRQHASHQGALDSSGDTPEGSKVHAARVLKAERTAQAWRAWGRYRSKSALYCGSIEARGAP